MKLFNTDKNNHVLCAVDALEIWLPKNYFSDNNNEALAQLNENSVSLIGIFPLRYREKPEGKFKVANFTMGASLILQIPSSREELKSTDISNTSENYMVIEYEKNDVVSKSTTIIQSNTAYSDAINLILSGKVPKNTPYRKIFDIATSAAEVNGYGLGIPAVLLQALIAALCRSTNTEIPYRMVVNNNSDSETNYVALSVKQLTRVESSFGMTFENLKDSVPYAIDRGEKNKPEPNIPIEDSL